MNENTLRTYTVHTRMRGHYLYSIASNLGMEVEGDGDFKYDQNENRLYLYLEGYSFQLFLDMDLPAIKNNIGIMLTDFEIWPITLNLKDRTFWHIEKFIEYINELEGLGKLDSLDGEIYYQHCFKNSTK
jgi:hypothetical protein